MYMSENWVEIAGYQTIIKIIIGIVFFFLFMVYYLIFCQENLLILSKLKIF